MAYNSRHHIVYQGVESPAGVHVKTHDYASNDGKTTIAANGYFNDASAHFDVGDIVRVRYNLNGTPGYQAYICNADGSSGDVKLTAIG